MYIRKNSSKLSAIATSCLLALILSAAYAGAPQGHLDSIEGQLKSRIYDGFEYLGRGNQSRFSEVAKAFLWDHREIIHSEKIKKSRQADAIVCILMVRYDRPGFEMYQESSKFVGWCQDLFRG